LPAGYYAPAARLLWHTLEGYTIDPAPVFTRCGIASPLPHDPDARIEMDAAECLWAQLALVTGDPAVGLRTAEFLHPSHFGALGYAWLASANLRLALQRLVRYVRIVTDLRHLELVDHGDNLELVTRYLRQTDSVPVRSDASLAVLVKMCRWNMGEDFRPHGIELQRPRPVDCDPYDALFGCPIHFGSNHDGLLIRCTDADQPCTGDHPKLAELNDAMVADYLQGQEQEVLIGRVREQIALQLSNGVVRMGRVAQALCMSERTLQRRLAEHHSSFRELLEAIRRELAEHYLGNDSMSISEVAFHAGFADISTFSRTVRQWTGLSPSHYRKRLMSEQARH